MLAKCKAASRESLTPLKRDRVNQHKAIDYFLQRSRTLISTTHSIFMIFMSNFFVLIGQTDSKNRRSAAFLISVCHFGGSERADWRQTRQRERSPDFLQNIFHFYFISSCSTRIE
ncbi:hypothetical protein DPR02_24830 [Burkholderia cepacia]|uniref:Uncharacterized protein n=1 Tax=Burkholderia cepacia TaxID=292 RepID=A0AAQ0JIW9_BURCE|nr:hypothetical protein DPR02_24830 [Burkholderia cepacia]